MDSLCVRIVEFFILNKKKKLSLESWTIQNLQFDLKPSEAHETLIWQMNIYILTMDDVGETILLLFYLFSFYDKISAN